MTPLVKCGQNTNVSKTDDLVAEYKAAMRKLADMYASRALYAQSYSVA